ncbi:MAG TPA: hypothetical protein VNU01_08645 [Egibacteraceae bacterium]|nr:hypothetical protein [Egibacteraceae bacterium]
MSEQQRLIDFEALTEQLRKAVAAIGMAAFVGAVAQTLRSGVDAGALLRWLTAFIALSVLAGAVLVAWHAYRGAVRSHGRGERLSGEDVGVVPPRAPRPRKPDDS